MGSALVERLREMILRLKVEEDVRAIMELKTVGAYLEEMRMELGRQP